MADGASKAGRKRKLPGSMQPKPPAPEPEVKLKSKATKNTHDSPPSKSGPPQQKVPKQVQTQLTFKPKPVEDQSHAIAVEAEPPKLKQSNAATPMSETGCLQQKTSPIKCSPLTMLHISDEDLLVQCRGFLRSSTCQASLDPGPARRKSDNQEGDISRGIDSRASQPRNPGDRKAQQSRAKADEHPVTLLTVSQDADRVIHPHNLETISESANSAGVAVSGASREVAPPAANTVGRSLLAELLGETLPHVSTASAAADDQPQARGSSDLGNSMDPVSGSNAGMSEISGRSQTVNGVTKAEGIGCRAHGQDECTAAVPPLDLGPTLPFPSAGSRAGAGKKLSLRERIKSLQSQ